MRSSLQLWFVALVICDFCNVHAYSVNGNKGIHMSAETGLNRRLFVSTSIASTVGWKLSNAVAAPLPSVNTKAPDFLLPNSREDGSKTNLENLTSTKKWTVLYFYPGAFTSGCTLEARGFQRDYDKYRQSNVQVVGISVDPPEKNAKFCESEKLDFYMLSDIGGEVSKSYGSALSVPGFGTFSNRQTYVIDPQGMIRHVFVDVESHVASHSQEVLDKLQELI
uniref:thioredoxin-dependent peroxiredoxin n=1 Tax=Eucampia antarctica TaxID=49252 RepID=A0A7S2R3P2_9STRA|mmetsp:Transcript_14572/g.14045  ORF Transcript_14572/g.14045 Transcript_14572/m.14045 type:complete len:222 (+) Transcript_14572:81-746(+)|eukprot:CAMPEP_0197834520 /NCGR_PEP_ID=MMETSP1437-20131217/22622_1 /TAXON_ID=49252 ORGANISM="Eucampia antarctica, Strain CCMP1452" /NCGR_SAMPLE_ID=MMETSP1437 /ASSEMBLY_ACC=CAM_ASM_001096 /LENGTH=221 /DNA_ID=CAMNT_0043439241 /DNA_START=61 /DNA_END=726 /DNA_ORIENTATION=+